MCGSVACTACKHIPQLSNSQVNEAERRRMAEKERLALIQEENAKQKQIWAEKQRYGISSTGRLHMCRQFGMVRHLLCVVLTVRGIT